LTAFYKFLDEMNIVGIPASVLTGVFFIRTIGVDNKIILAYHSTNYILSKTLHHGSRNFSI